MSHLATSIHVYQGNTLPDLKGQITFDATLQITPESVELSAQSQDGQTLIDHQACGMTVANDVIDWTYEVQAGDYAMLGRFVVFLTVSFDTGEIQDVQAGFLVVHPPYGEQPRVVS